MNKENLSKARKMAQESIYDDAQYVGRWNGFEVYEPTFNDDEMRRYGSNNAVEDFAESMKMFICCRTQMKATYPFRETFLSKLLKGH